MMRPADGGRGSAGATALETPSLPEVHRSVPIPVAGSWLRRMFAFAGPAYLVSVGYMDPGNWATDLAGGARFGYQLIWVLVMSNLMPVLLRTLVVTIGACFATEIALSKPALAEILKGFIPRGEDGRVSLFARNAAGGVSVLGLSRESLYIAMGILGATVMPHNLYLHSSLVQSRSVEHSAAAKRQACRMNLVDSVVALNCAVFVNAAILVLAGAVFHQSGHQDVARLEGPPRLFAP